MRKQNPGEYFAPELIAAALRRTRF